MKRKSFWVFLAAGITVVSTVASAQWIDRETLTRMVSRGAGSQVAVASAETTAALPTVGMLGEFKRKSLVGSWVETVNFLDGPMKGRVLTGLVSFHDDGTVLSSDQGSVTTDPPPPAVTSDGIGAWTQTDWRTFLYTEKSLFSDFSGNLTGFLKVSGTYTLHRSGDTYTGTSFYQLYDASDNPLTDPGTSGSVSNNGVRIRVEPTPAPTP